jgi:Zn-dependent protease
MALSGPASNLAAAFLTGLFIRFYTPHYPIYQILLIYMLIMNIGLGLFNLLPIPPLDGSHVLENILTPRASIKYRQIRRYAPFILIGILLADNYLNINIFGRLLTIPIFKLAHLFGGDNFFKLLGFFY